MRPRESNISSSIITFALVGSLLIAGIVLAIIISTGSVQRGMQVLITPFLIAAVVLIFANPYFGILIYLHYSYLFVGLTRYIPGIPLGLLVDTFLFLTILSSLQKIQWKSLKQLNNGLFYTTMLWFLYTALEMINPNAVYLSAWFYAVRGISLYAAMAIPLALLLFNSKADLDKFIRLVLGYGVFSTIWGLKQLTFGPDYAEANWLETTGKVTHVLAGRLRAFSVYSDAGQYGATMAFTSFIALVLALGPYDRNQKIKYFAIAAFTFIGFAISGSRGPLFVIITGFIFYLFLIRRFRVLAVGLIVGVVVFAFLKFTYIGNSNYQIFRMRTALDPKDASLLVRLKNQETLRKYLDDKPFGSGVGTADYWGQRFYPGSFLANVPVDSWFVRIWVETGVIGLAFHILNLAYVLVMGYANAYNALNPDLRQKLIGLYGGFAGVIIASFGNPVFGQAPLGALMYLTMVFLTLGDEIDKEINQLPSIE